LGAVVVIFPVERAEFFDKVFSRRVVALMLQCCVCRSLSVCGVMYCV